VVNNQDAPRRHSFSCHPPRVQIQICTVQHSPKRRPRERSRRVLKRHIRPQLGRLPQLAGNNHDPQAAFRESFSEAPRTLLIRAQVRVHCVARRGKDDRVPTHHGCHTCPRCFVVRLAMTSPALALTE